MIVSFKLLKKKRFELYRKLSIIKLGSKESEASVLLMPPNYVILKIKNENKRKVIRSYLNELV